MAGARRNISPGLRKQALEKAGYVCAACGASEPLEICHIVPTALGGTSDPDNLTVLCANCHRLMDSGPAEFRFVSYLAGLIEHHPDFSQTIREALIGRSKRYRAD